MKKPILMVAMALAATNTFAQDKDWAQFGRYEKQNAEMTTSPDVVFMGNSITDFWYNFDETFFKNNNFAGRGISGQTTAQMLVRFRKDVIELNPKAVVILAGINDIAQNNGPIKLENVLSNIISMSELARYHKIKVILCSILPCNHFTWRPDLQPAEDVKHLNAMIKDYACKNKMTFVDYYTPLVNDEGGLSPELSKDGCHPVYNCYTTMESIVTKGINKALNNRKAYHVSAPKEDQ
ncbi:MAG: GDSL-type esterase/lipase family protein [Bacteroidales bacterium]|nr:GDSL-type esterase/lipase family protein [Bacteroidales bacterium]